MLGDPSSNVSTKGRTAEPNCQLQPIKPTARMKNGSSTVRVFNLKVKDYRKSNNTRHEYVSDSSDHEPRNRYSLPWLSGELLDQPCRQTQTQQLQYAENDQAEKKQDQQVHHF